MIECPYSNLDYDYDYDYDCDLGSRLESLYTRSNTYNKIRLW